MHLEHYITKDIFIFIWLVVWTPLKNISQLGWLFPIYGKIKNGNQTTNQSWYIHKPLNWAILGHFVQELSTTTFPLCHSPNKNQRASKQPRAFSIWVSESCPPASRASCLGSKLATNPNDSLVISQLAIENGPFLIDLPIRNGNFHHCFL